MHEDGFYGSTPLPPARPRSRVSRRMLWALSTAGALLLAIGLVTVLLHAPTETELLAQHYGGSSSSVFEPSFWKGLYNKIDEDPIANLQHHQEHHNSHYFKQNGDFSKFLEHLNTHWDDADASKSVGYHHKWGTADNIDLNDDADLRNKAAMIAHHIIVHYKVHPHVHVHHRWHHWAHWYSACHPVCHKDAMWPVEKRLAAKLLYLWDHWHVAAPEFSPHGGVFVDSVTVTLTPENKNEMIYYTTDGTIPTQASKQYMGPIAIGTPGAYKIQAFAIKDDMGPSQVVSQSYLVQARTATPTIAPIPNGPFTNSVTISMECATEDAEIQFTTDGTDPSGTWHTVYKNPFEISELGDIVIKARAIKEGMASSLVDVQKYHIQAMVASPVISPEETGPYITSATISISCSSLGSMIHYTTDGSNPTTSSSIEYIGPFEVTQIGQVTIQAYATLDGLTPSNVVSRAYTIEGQVKPPTFTPEGGNFVTFANVQIESQTPGAKIYYTVDGTIPTASSLVYAAPIHVDSVGTNTIKAMATKVGMGDSDVSSLTIDILQQVSAPVITPPSSSPFTTSVTIDITSQTPAATIYYTIDGSTPNENSVKYEKPFDITVLGTTKVSAYAVAPNMGDSDVTTTTYTVRGKIEPVVISPSEPGPYTETVTVTMSTPTPGATIHYTLDGTNPTSASPIYSSPLAITTPGAISVHAIALEDGMTDSDVTDQTYNVLARVATPVLGPQNGPFVTSVTVSMSCATPDSTIHYTSDGSDPTAVSPVYNAPFTLSTVATTTIQAICVKPGMADSLVAKETFDVLEKAAPPTITPTSGTFVTTASITISSSIADAAIHYTVDGSTPTDASPTYSAPIALSTVGSNTVKAIVTKDGMGDSDVAQATVDIIAQLAPPTISPDGGDFRRDDLHKGALITLAPAAPGPTIYYTTDGSIPTPDKAIKYDGDSFLLCSMGTFTIKAISSEAGMADSNVASAVFTIMKQQCLETIFEGCPPPGQDGSNEPLDMSGCTY